MRRLTVAAAAIFMVSAALGHGGNHTQLPDPGKTPGDMLYGLERAQESVSLALTFSQEAKTEKKLRFARERLSESVHLLENNRTDKASKAAEMYVDTLGDANSTAEKAGAEDVQEDIRKGLEQRNEMLQELQQRLPEQAQPGIEETLSAGPPEDLPVNNRSQATAGFVVTGGAVP